MYSSSYYKQRRNTEQSKVNKYEDNIEDLEKIRSKLLNDFGDEVSSVNSALDDLEGDLSNAVRHLSSFTEHADSHLERKQKLVTADSCLDSAADEMNEEILRLKSLRDEADDRYREYDALYRQAKEREDAEARRKWQETLNNIFGGDDD